MPGPKKPGPGTSPWLLVAVPTAIPAAMPVKPSPASPSTPWDESSLEGAPTDRSILAPHPPSVANVSIPGRPGGDSRQYTDGAIGGSDFTTLVFGPVPEKAGRYVGRPRSKTVLQGGRGPLLWPSR